MKDTVAGFRQTLPTPRSSLTRRLVGSPCGFSFLALRGRTRRHSLRQNLMSRVHSFLLRLNVKFTFLNDRCPLIMDNGRCQLSLLFCRIELRYCIILSLGVKRFRPRRSNRVDFCITTISGLVHARRSTPAVNVVLYQDGSGAVMRCTLRKDRRPVNISAFRARKRLPPSVRDDLPAMRRFRVRLDATVSRVRSRRERSPST